LGAGFLRWFAPAEANPNKIAPTWPATPKNQETSDPEERGRKAGSTG